MTGVASPAQPGVVLLGGAHGALAAARSFGRKGIPVVFVTDDHPLPKFSRYVTRSFGWPGAKAPDAVGWLQTLAQTHGLSGWLLVPCADDEVRLIAEHRDALREFFRVVSPGWDVLVRVCDKNQLVGVAAEIGLPFPRSYRVGSVAELAALDIVFPVVLKPAQRQTRNRFTQDKAWRADSLDQLKRLYQEASGYVGQANVIVQEYIPGGGETQFSYAALWRQGQPVEELIARRTRQYPVEFSYSSTFVEVVSNEHVEALGRKLLSHIEFEGLAEIEFKYDTRSDLYKVLDVNPRIWTWFGLCSFTGSDLALLMWEDREPDSLPPPGKQTARAWMHASRDVVAAMQLMLSGQLSVSAYLRSCCQKITFSSFAWDDPLPGILELPLVALRVLMRSASRLFSRLKSKKAAISA